MKEMLVIVLLLYVKNGVHRILSPNCEIVLPPMLNVHKNVSGTVIETETVGLVLFSLIGKCTVFVSEASPPLKYCLTLYSFYCKLSTTYAIVNNNKSFLSQFAHKLLGD